MPIIFRISRAVGYELLSARKIKSVVLRSRRRPRLWSYQCRHHRPTFPDSPPSKRNEADSENEARPDWRSHARQCILDWRHVITCLASASTVPVLLCTRLNTGKGGAALRCSRRNRSSEDPDEHHWTLARRDHPNAPAADYAERQGWNLKNRGRTLSPLPASRGDNAQLHVQSRYNPSKCFGCGAGGSVIDGHSEAATSLDRRGNARTFDARRPKFRSSNRKKHSSPSAGFCAGPKRNIRPGSVECCRPSRSLRSRDSGDRRASGALDRRPYLLPQGAGFSFAVIPMKAERGL